MARGTTDAANAAFAANIPLGRLGTPEDVAEVAAFLASEAAGYARTSRPDELRAALEAPLRRRALVDLLGASSVAVIAPLFHVANPAAE